MATNTNVQNLIIKKCHNNNRICKIEAGLNLPKSTVSNIISLYGERGKTDTQGQTRG